MMPTARFGVSRLVRHPYSLAIRCHADPPRSLSKLFAGQNPATGQRPVHAQSADLLGRFSLVARGRSDLFWTGSPGDALESFDTGAGGRAGRDVRGLRSAVL